LTHKTLTSAFHYWGAFCPGCFCPRGTLSNFFIETLFKVRFIQDFGLFRVQF